MKLNSFAKFLRDIDYLLLDFRFFLILHLIERFFFTMNMYDYTKFLLIINIYIYDFQSFELNKNVQYNIKSHFKIILFRDKKLQDKNIPILVQSIRST